MKKITLEAITKAGFEIIENVDDCYVSAPIDMTSVDGGTLSDLNIGSYNVDLEKQEIETGDSQTTFTILKNEVEEECDISIDEVKEYFERYFEKYPEELK